MPDYSPLFNTFLAEPLHGSGKNQVSYCPFCEHEDKKFSVNIETGKAQCMSGSCGVTCNQISFLTLFHEAWLEYTEDEHYQELSEARGIGVDTLKRAKLAYDSYHDRWLIPYKNPFSTHLCNLGHFLTKGKKKFVIYKVPNVNDEFPLTFYNPYQNLKHPKTDTCAIIEGEWDTLAHMDLAIDDEEADTQLGVPGALIFPVHCKKWLEKFTHANLFYDNDEAGQTGLGKAAIGLQGWGKEFHGLEWSEIPESTDDMDLRDMLIQRPDIAYTQLYEALCEVDLTDAAEPEELSAGYVASMADISEVPKFKRYLDLYGKHMHLTDINMQAIALNMAIATCQYIPGEPLWFFLRGPAGGGKTTLIESFGGNNEYFDYCSRITPKNLVSGWVSGGDPSLIQRMNGKTFFIKDFTVVLDMSKDQRRETFSLFRDIYDGTLNITFGNGKVCNFHNLRFNLIAGVTDEIMKHNDASCGERFLRLDYMGDDIQDELIIDKALRGFGKTDQRKKELTDATLGYVKTLARPDHLWDLNRLPELSEYSRNRLSSLARYTAFVRTRLESDRKDGIRYRPRKEIAARLALQYAKIAYALEKVWNPALNANGSKSFDLSDRTLDHVAKVAFDTSDSFNQEVVTTLYNSDKKLGRKDLVSRLELPISRIHTIMTELKATKLVKTVNRPLSGGQPKTEREKELGRPSEYYSIHPDFQPIMEEIYG